MKIKIIPIAIIIGVTLSLADQNETASTEEEAIKSTIASGTTNWANRNFEGLAATWAHEKYVLAMYPSPEGYYEFAGWDSLSCYLKRFYLEDSILVNLDITRSDWSIHLYGNAKQILKKLKE